MSEPSNKNGTDAVVAKKSKPREWIETILWAVILALAIRAVFIQAYKIPTGSMQPTLRGAENFGTGDHLLVNKFVYGSVIDLPLLNKFRLPAIRNPTRGDVVVFKYPVDPSLDFVKRCIGLPGETLEVKNKNVYINGALLNEPWLKRISIKVIKGKVNIDGNPLDESWVRASKIEVEGKDVYVNGTWVKTKNSELRKHRFKVVGTKDPQEVFIDGNLVDPPWEKEYNFTIQNGEVLVNGKNIDDALLNEMMFLKFHRDGETYQPAFMSNKDNFGPIHIPDGCYFMMGDNRDNSHDSRFWGVLEHKYIRGQAVLVYWPLPRLRIVH